MILGLTVGLVVVGVVAIAAAACYLIDKNADPEHDEVTGHR